MLYLKYTGHVVLRRMYCPLNLYKMFCVILYVKRITHLALCKMYYAL